MSPYKRSPRRHFTDYMMSPYFQTNHYKENHVDFENKVEDLAKKFLAKIFRKNKK